MTETISSIIDQPITLSGQESLDDKDRFGISRYERALTKFIEQADTPLTIALQGEWGSGKTSLMNLLKYHLCEADDAPYYPVWINTWQYSIMSNTESSIIGILQGIIYQLGNAVGELDGKRQKIGSMFANVGKIAAIAAMNIAGKVIGAGAVGTEVNAATQATKAEQEGESVNGDSRIAELRRSIAEFIAAILKGEEGKTHPHKGFLFFIDDLDRIDPPVAVQILELLKNIFDLEHCIYILAIDYDVVVKGLKPKFGELTDRNAREFRSFFDKIIQLPFAMPVGSYHIDNFLIDALGRIGYLTEAEQKNEDLKKNISEMALYSVGKNPRSLKRLTNILSLIRLMTEEGGDDGSTDKQEPEDVLLCKQVNFALVCLQITYPLVYNTLLEYPNFRHWGDENDDLDSSGKISLVKKLSLQELSKEQQGKLEKQGELFDEPWEKTLFRICLKDNYLCSRANDISQLLNKISSIVPMSQEEGKATAEKDHDEAVAEMIDRLIRFSAVTNVHVTDDAVSAKKIEDFNPSWWLKQFRDRFVPAFNSRMKGQDILKCTNGRVQNRLHFIFVNQERAGTDGHYSVATMGHDDSSYTLTWENGIAFLHGGFGTIEEEEQLLGCPGLHESIVREMREYASQYPEFNLNMTDSYEKMNQADQKHGAFQMIVKYARNQLEELVADEAIQRFADFLSGLMRIRFKAIPEIHAFCHGHDDILRKQLEKIDIAPFSNRRQWISQTYLDGLKIGNDSFGLSLHLCSNGFRAILWEAHSNLQKLYAMLEAHPELDVLFPELHEDGNRKHPEIIPFDSVIDWLKNLQSILIRAQ